MKLKTNYSVTLPVTDAVKLLSKYVEKKTNKKVLEAAFCTENNEQTFTFTLQGEESVIEAQKEG